MKRCLGIFSVICITLSMTACSTSGPSEHYVSPQIEVQSSKINLDEVNKAFFESKGTDFKTWMSAFEKRVNEIYDGKEIISIDATRENDKLVVTGYVDNKKEPGFQKDDEKIFTIEQTGAITNNDMPYKVANYDGSTHYMGHRSIFDNPFIQMMVFSHMMNSWGGRYHTPYDRMGPLGSYRAGYRQTPQFEQQKTANQGFMSRFKSKAGGTGLQSKSTFGAGGFSSGSTEKRRSWFGGGSSSTSGVSSSSSWGGRRSSGFKMRGWGGRRR